MRSKRYIVAAGLIAGLLRPHATTATEYACDAPADKYDSVYLDISGETKIAGAVRKMEFRPGRFLPVAGARLENADKTATLGFQLSAPSADAQEYKVIINVDRGDGHQSEIIGRVPASENIPFSIALTDGGDASLNIRNYNYTTKFVPLTDGKAMFFCSTGQFQFSDLAASTSRPSQSGTSPSP